jgi:hypothetical protein
MSRVTGGIYSRPSGKTAGIVWGAARTRTGKVATARQLVPPSNPNTPAQRTQRNKFREALFIVRSLGSIIYAIAWNRSIGQLPGFQSMLSVMLNSLSSNFTLAPPVSINLGTLHLPTTMSTAFGTPNGVKVNWSTENGSNGTPSDLAQILVIGDSDSTRRVPGSIVSSTTAIRSTGTANIGGLDSGSGYVIIVYFKGTGTSTGLFSATESFAQESS